VVKVAGLEQLAHDDGDAADAVDVDHVEPSVGLGVGDVRCAPAHPGEVVEGELDARFVGDGEQVQDGVGAPPEGHGDGDGIFERLLAHDVARPEAELEEPDHRLPAGKGQVVAAGVDGGGRGAAGQGHAEGLGDRRHRVGREHPGAAANGRAGAVLDQGQLLVAQRTRGPGADRFEDTRDVEGLAVGTPPRHDAAAVEEHRREVDPSGRHQHAREGLVTAGEGDHPVETLGVHDRLDTVGDHLPAHERRPHPFVAHGDAVGHGDGDELEREAAGGPDAVLGPLGQAVEGQVARRDLVPRGRHSDLGPAPVVVGHADGAEHGPGRGPLEPVGDLAAAGLHRVGCTVAGHGRQTRCGAVG
jgi:hypothetical protein